MDLAVYEEVLAEEKGQRAELRTRLAKAGYETVHAR